jgi:hypothetical protein
MSEGESKVGGGLSVGSGCGSVSGSDGRIPDKCVYIAGFGGVMYQPAGVVDAEVFHRGQHACIQFQTTGHWKRVGDGPAGQLVAERDLLGLDGQQPSLFGSLDC